MACSLGRLRWLYNNWLTAANARRHTQFFPERNSGNVVLALSFPPSQYILIGRPFVFCFFCRIAPSRTISPSVLLNASLLTL